MALEIIGAGFGRTGTLSTKAALETLGFGPCHHMAEVFARREQLDVWNAVVSGKSTDWDEVFDGYRSCVDWPSTSFWRELAAFYPTARVIVTLRPVDSWIQSMQATVCRLISERQDQANPHFRNVLELAQDVVADRSFGGLLDGDALARAFEQRINDVKATVDPERLLFFDVRDGWSPLCKFLDVPVPDTRFPRGNSQEEFWKTFSS